MLIFSIPIFLEIWRTQGKKMSNFFPKMRARFLILGFLNHEIRVFLHATQYFNFFSGFGQKIIFTQNHYFFVDPRAKK